MGWSIIFIIFVVSAGFILWLTRVSTTEENEKKKAGNFGEDIAEKRIRRILNEEDLLLRNIKFKFDDKSAELDFVILNSHGIFVIETKNFAGYLVGHENDYMWKKYRMTKGRKIYEKDVQNPLKQVGRQVYLFSKYLNQQDIRVWINGYVYMINGNKPTYVNKLLLNENDVEKVIHKSGDERLDPRTLKKIVTILRHQSKKIKTA